jgi:hypothetical protein
LVADSDHYFRVTTTLPVRARLQLESRFCDQTHLFGAFQDAATLRSELQRLFLWLKARRVTVVITGERGEGS